MINSRKIEDLHQVAQIVCRKHITACKARGIHIILTSTLRDNEYQASLYAQGRTKPGKIVTNMSKVGPHGFGLAWDVVPVVDGIAIWNNNEYWKIIGEEGKKLGLVWGGDWKSFVDKPHFEMTQGLTATQLRECKRPDWYVNFAIIRGKKFIPIHSLNKARCASYNNCISGTFQYKNVTSSMLCAWGSWKRKSSTHDWLKQPETVLYQTRSGEVKAQRCLVSSEIKDDVLHAIGGLGLHNYDPKVEGFAGKYADVVMTNKHTAFGYDGKEFIGVYFPKANGKQMKSIMIDILNCEVAVLLDGGHIAAINCDEAKINTNQVQNNMVQIF